MKKRIGVIGYGTLGKYLTYKINTTDDMKLEFVYDIDRSKMDSLDKSLILTSPEEIRNQSVDLIVEVASAEWVKNYGSFVLEFTNLLTFSVTAFAQKGLQEKLDEIAMKNKTKYYISHGAVLGLDGILDGRDLMEKIHITTIKPPEKLGIKERIPEKKVLYEGPSRRACELYPRNVNVHASLALHGIGFDSTTSKIIADPDTETMRHIIHVTGKGIDCKIDIKSRPIGDVTGSYTPESLFQTVRRLNSEKYGMNFI
jgi:aspartate dehydrogenase